MAASVVASVALPISNNFSFAPSIDAYGKLSEYGKLGAWSPLSLFAASEVGAWYDPSDLTTMFQDSAGTTPVTADGQPLGLILDKSPNLANATQTVSGNRPVTIPFDNSDTGIIYPKSTSALSVTLGSGNYYHAAAVPNLSFVDVTFSGPHSHAGGAYALPNVDWSGLIIIDRAFTSDEQTDIRNYFGKTPVITTPDQSVLTVSVQKALTADVSGAWLIDGVSAGTGASINYTPSNTDFDVTISCGGGRPIKAVVAEANVVTQNINSWSKTNTTVTSGISDPFGGTAAYKVNCNANGSAAQHLINTTINPAGAALDAGFEIWAEYNASMPVLMIYPIESGATHYARINLLTGEAIGNFSECFIAESIGNWKRVIYKGLQDALFRTPYLYLCKTLAGNSDITTGTEYMSLYAPRRLEGEFPLYAKQSAYWRYDSVVTGFDRWLYRSKFNSSENYVNSDFSIFVLKPDSYNAANKYPVVYVGLTEYQPNSLANPLTVIKNAGLHNTHDCIFAMVQYHSSIIPWYGEKNDGTMNVDKINLDVVRNMVDVNYSTIKHRDGRLFLGMSKSGWGAMSLLLKNPNVLGYAAMWDAPFNVTWPGTAYGIDVAFGTEVKFNAYDPKQILTSYLASVSDRKRIVLAGYYTFSQDQLDFKALLDAHGVEYSYLRTLEASHDWLNAWIAPTVSALMGLRNG